MDPRIASFSVAAMLAALAACAPAPQNDSRSGPPAALEGQREMASAEREIRMLTYPAPPGALYHAEAAEGTIVTEGRCLYLRTAGFRFLLIFPEGTRWDPGAGAVSFGGRLLKPGERATLSGSSVAGTQDLGPGFNPQDCDTRRTFRVAPWLARP